MSTSDHDELATANEDGQDTVDVESNDDKDLPVIEAATPEQARALKGPKKAAAIPPAITLKSTGVTVELDEAPDDAPTVAQPIVRASRNGGAATKSSTGVQVRKSGAVGPPGKKPPAALGPPEPEGSFLQRNKKWLIPLAAVAGIVVLLLVYVLIKSLTTPESNKIAASADEILTPVNEQIDDADKIAEFRETARDARLARTKIAELQTRSQEIGDAKERATVVALLDAETALLDAYAGSTDVRRNNLKPVEKLIDQAKEASRALIAADGQMTAIDRTGSVDEALVASAVENMDDTLTVAQRKMAAWTRRNRLMKKKRAQFAAQAGSLEGYAAQMRAQRSEVGRFSDAPPSETFSSGGTTIDGFTQDRKRLKTTVSAAVVGPLLTQAKSELVSALGESVDAFEKLRSAWGGQGMHETVGESSGFAAYDSATDDVDSAMASFVANMNSARSTAKSRYRAPRMPDV